MINLLRPLALFAALLAAFSAPLASADPQGLPHNETVKAVPVPEQARPALWKVADRDTTIWLFGTIHALPSDVEWFDGKVATAFDGSQVLVTEIVEADPATMKTEFLKRAMLPAGQTLRDQLSPDARSKYEAALARLGLPTQVFDAFEPWYAAITLSLLPLLQDGFDRDHGVETTLESRAKALNLRHEALETPDAQLDMFDQLPVDAQKRYLGEVVQGLPTIKDDLKAMITAWKSGDAKALAQLMNAQEDDPALIEALLTRRNRAWAGWIRDRLKQPGTVFVAVGAGHLAGPGSVQEQLRSRGIASTRVQ